VSRSRRSSRSSPHPADLHSVILNARRSTRGALLLALAALAAGCGGGSESSSVEALSKAIARYADLPSGDADALATSIQSDSPDALDTLTRAIDGLPALPSAASVAADLERAGESQGFDGKAALPDLCDAVAAGLAPRPTVRLDAGGGLVVDWSGGDPVMQLGPAVHRASLRTLERALGAGDYSAGQLEELDDTLLAAAEGGVSESSEPGHVPLWLRLRQVRSAACE
jgi:hypothetical protein